MAYFLYTKLEGNLQNIDLRTFNLPLLLLAIFIFGFHNLFNAYVWDYMMKNLDNKTSLIEQMDVYMRSYVLRYIPGHVAGIMARGVFNKKYKISMVQSLWGWFLENVTYLGISVIIGSYAVAHGAISSKIMLGLMGLTILVAIIMSVRSDLLEKIFNMFLVKKIAKEHPEKIEEAHFTMKNGSRVKLVLAYVFAWFIYSFSYIVVLVSLGVDVTRDPLLLISINALSYAVGYLSFVTPSGAGIREGVMVVALTEVAGIAPEIAILGALGARVVFILGELLGFSVFYVSKFFINRNGK